MSYKIEIQRPGCWEFMKTKDGIDAVYEKYYKALEVALSIEGCYKLIDKNYNLEVKEVQ